jgi:hypothetical protein
VTGGLGAFFSQDAKDFSLAVSAQDEAFLPTERELNGHDGKLLAEPVLIKGDFGQEQEARPVPTDHTVSMRSDLPIVRLIANATRLQ